VNVLALHVCVHCLIHFIEKLFLILNLKFLWKHFVLENTLNLLNNPTPFIVLWSRRKSQHGLVLKDKTIFKDSKYNLFCSQTYKISSVKL